MNPYAPTSTVYPTGQSADITGMVSYDPAVLQRYADQLYARARLSIMLHCLFGFVVGVGVQNVPMLLWYWSRTPGNPPNSDPDTFWIGAAIGSVILGLIGNGRALKFRMLAQTALCQMQIEQNTRPPRTSEAIAGIDQTTGQIRYSGPPPPQHHGELAPSNQA
jgi:hypothetical protein